MGYIWIINHGSDSWGLHHPQQPQHPHRAPARDETCALWWGDRNALRHEAPVERPDWDGMIGWSPGKLFQTQCIDRLHTMYAHMYIYTVLYVHHTYICIIYMYIYICIYIHTIYISYTKYTDTHTQRHYIVMLCWICGTTGTRRRCVKGSLYLHSMRLLLSCSSR